MNIASAASLLRICNVWKTNRFINISRSFCDSAQPTASASPEIDPKKEYVVPSRRGFIICWHPKQKHPYEHTKPVPREEAALREGDSQLNIQLRKEDLLRHYPKGPSLYDLQNMFYTNKHQWYTQRRLSRMNINAQKAPKYRRGL